MSCPPVLPCPVCGHGVDRHKKPFSVPKDAPASEKDRTICMECTFGPQQQQDRR